MTINRWASFEGSSTPRPLVAPGTPCAPCAAKGHFCPAYEMVDGRAVCLYCLDGVPCMRPSRNGGAAPAPAAKRAAVMTSEPMPTTPQPALAAGAEPSPAMPARRHFGVKTAAQRPWATKALARERAKGMLAAGSSVLEAMKATGLSKSTVARVRGELPGLPRTGNGGRPPGNAAEELPIDATKSAKHPVAKRVMAALVDAARSAATRVPMAEAAAVESTRAAAGDMWKAVSRAGVPGRVNFGVHDAMLRRLQALPADQALERVFRDHNAARNFGDAVQKAAGKRGIKISFRVDGAALYVWLRSPAEV